MKSPAYPWVFENPLPIPPIAQPVSEETVNGRTVQYFEHTIEAFEYQIYPNLGPTHLVGYNSMAPGPTFRVQKGTESIVRILNKGTGAGSGTASVHLHGSSTHSPWDGWASDLIQSGQYKDYYYPNNQASPLWYHDHVDGETGTHVYYGQHGLYFVEDPDEESLGLPSGDYDIPLALVDKAYQYSGELAPPEASESNFWGDILHVNGQPWPYLEVEPRKYRFRIYDMSLSRPYDLSFVGQDGAGIEFRVIASDGGAFRTSCQL